MVRWKAWCLVVVVGVGCASNPPTPSASVQETPLLEIKPLPSASPSPSTSASLSPPLPAPSADPIEEDADASAPAYTNVARAKQCCHQLGVEARRLGNSPDASSYAQAELQCLAMLKASSPRNVPELGVLRVLLAGRPNPPVCAGF